MTALPFVLDDGGRKEAGFKGHTGDCTTRAISIATGALLAQAYYPEPAEVIYQEVYDDLNELSKGERTRYYKHGKRAGKAIGRSSARTGVSKPIIKKYLAKLGWTWYPTMGIGSGCTVHLAVGELPMDRPLIVQVSMHMCAVVNGVVHDTYDPTRDGTRCVYGYWTKP